jgi:hypothetical protein
MKCLKASLIWENSFSRKKMTAESNSAVVTAMAIISMDRRRQNFSAIEPHQ